MTSLTSLWENYDCPLKGCFKNHTKHTPETSDIVEILVIQFKQSFIEHMPDYTRHLDSPTANKNVVAFTTRRRRYSVLDVRTRLLVSGQAGCGVFIGAIQFQCCVRRFLAVLLWRKVIMACSKGRLQDIFRWLSPSWFYFDGGVSDLRALYSGSLYRNMAEPWPNAGSRAEPTRARRPTLFGSSVVYMLARCSLRRKWVPRFVVFFSECKAVLVLRNALLDSFFPFAFVPCSLLALSRFLSHFFVVFYSEFERPNPVLIA